MATASSCDVVFADDLSTEKVLHVCLSLRVPACFSVVCLSFSLSLLACLFACTSVFLSIRELASLPCLLLACLPGCLSAFLHTYLSLCLFVCWSVFLSIRPPVSLPVWL